MSKSSNKAIPRSINQYKSSNERNIDDYSMNSMRERVIKSMDMYLGSPERQEMELVIFENDKVVMKSFETSSAVLNCFWEVLANAIDHTIHTLDERGKVTPIKITANNKTIAVTNGGKAIPIEKKEFSNDDGKTKMTLWIPEAMFGYFNSSSNYKDNITSIGKNGFGAKGVSTVSKESSVLVVNSISGKMFSQTWSNNMKDVCEPKVEKHNSKESSVSYKYTLDFPLFNCEEYSEDELNLFHYHCLCAQYSLEGVEVIFNDQPCKFDTLIQDSLSVRSNLTVPFSDWKKITWDEKEKKQSSTKKNETPKYTPKYHCEIYDTPGNSTHMCFVNGRYVKNGSTLIDQIIKTLSLPIIRDLNGTTGKKVTWNNFASHLSVVVRIDRFINPVYDNQSKERQTNGSLIVTIPVKVKKQFSDFETLNILTKTQKHLILKKTDGKKASNVIISRARNANLAGTKNSKECILIISEGDSGKSFGDVFTALCKNGKDRIGCMALRGKGMVVRNKSETREAANEEITRLKQMLGLREGVNYDTEKEFSTLNYGQLWVFVDPDDDGIHIIAIVLDYFCVRFPSLIKRGFIKYPHLPYATLDNKDGNILQFMYTMGDYKKQRQTKRNKGEEILYFKGLGSFENRHIEYFFNNAKLINFSFDKYDENVLKLMFDSRLSHERRDWIDNYEQNPDVYIELVNNYPSKKLTESNLDFSYTNIIQPPRDLINNRGIDYALTSISRSIPGFDGLKESQRDIVWACLKKWPSFNNPEKMKVPQFCGYTSEKCHYAYGDGSIPQTVKKLLFDYVGKNNLPYLHVIGQIGCREVGGKDCASERYLHIKPKKWVELMFRREFIPLLDMITDDDVEIKPRILWSVIDMALVNGTMGTSTGWTSRIPNHNPIHIIDWHIRKLEKNKLPLIKPWYNHFKGTIELEDITQEELDKELQKEVTTNNDSSEDSNDNTDTDPADLSAEDEKVIKEASRISGRRYVITGCFRDITSNYKYRDDAGKLVNRKRPTNQFPKDETIYQYEITELPIGKWTEKYVNNALKLCSEKKLYSSVRDISERADIKIYINSLPGKPLDARSLKLITYIPAKLFVLIRNGKPKKYESTLEFLEDFHQETLKRYIMRIEREVTVLKEQVDNEELYQKYCSDVRSKELDLASNTEKVENKMKEKGYPLEFLDRKTRSILKDDKGKKLESLKARLKIMENKKPESLWKEELLELREHLETYEGY